MPTQVQMPRLYDGTKSVPLESLPVEAWRFITGEDVSGATNAGLKTLFSKVPWLYRGVHLRALALQALPFDIYQGDTVVDSSDDYQNVVGFLPDIFDLLYLSEGAMTLFGRNFLFQGRNLLSTVETRWLAPPSVIPVWDPKNGLIGFKRSIGGSVIPLDVEDIVYTRVPNFWSETERGQSAAEAALSAAGVLFNMDSFIANFFARGAVKATLLTVEGNPQRGEKDRLLNWWRRVMSGVKNAWSTDVVQASVKPVTVGEGLENLHEEKLSKSKREDIATALGIPQSLLFSTGSINRAVSQQDDLNFYDKAIVPESVTFARSWNRQMLEPAGYRIQFVPDRLNAFKQDEEMRAGALQSLVSAGFDLDIAVDVLGYNLTDDQLKRIIARVKEKEEARAALRERLTSPATDPNAPTNVIGQQKVDQDENEEEEDEEGAPMKVDLDRWHRKALRRFRESGSAKTPFMSEHIPPVLHASIGAHLELAESEREVDAAFNMRWANYP